MEPLCRARKLVVAGLIVAAEGGRALVTRRRSDQAMPLLWEFPGGKIEHGESPEAALERELAEELGVEVQVGKIWEVLFHSYPEFDLLMLVYACRLVGDQEPRCLEVEALAWCTPAEMSERAFLPADTPLVRRLLREGLPAPRQAVAHRSPDGV